MPAKVDTYLDLARETALGLSGSVGAWTAFLDTASRLYKYPFADQLMIHAQRPEATACASYEVWNDTMRRYVRRGAKGIALLDNSGDAPRLRYVFDIADTGIGISEQHQGAIFKRFYREDAVHDVDGIGIGLYLAREIVTLQGGYIRVASEVGKGSTFSVFLLRK